VSFCESQAARPSILKPFAFLHRKYLKDAERKELFNQATTLCLQAVRNLLKKHVEEKNEEATIELMKEIFKNYRKCSKYMQNKESVFGSGTKMIKVLRFDCDFFHNWEVDF
jgi:uncharacterized protein (UPF0305 family)